MALGFLSLCPTVAVLVVLAIGTAKLARSARAAWRCLSGVHDGTVSVGCAMTQSVGTVACVGVVPEVAGCEEEVVGLIEPAQCHVMLSAFLQLYSKPRQLL